MLRAINPATGEVIDEFEAMSEASMSQAIDGADKAFVSWRDKSFAERSKVLRAVAAELRKRKDELARLMALEMGKPIKEGGPEVEKAAWCAEHYAEHGEAYLAPQTIASDAAESYVCHQPLGVVLGILPWNAPLWLAFRFLAPALMAGNTCVIKHDPHVPACAKAIAHIFVAAGAPANIMSNLPLATRVVAAAIRHPLVRAVSFTGSTQAGAQVAKLAGEEIKPVVLELGGSDPCVVLADADFERAADIATLSRIINAGQSCIAAKRVIVEAPIYERFVEALLTRLSKLKMGDPLQGNTDVGPIARQDLRENLHRQVSETIAASARCLLGGEPQGGAGYFYPPTLLVDVMPHMCAFREETFGPVMAVTRAENAEHALELANETDYGLGASVWTADRGRALDFANRLNAGQVAINGIVKTDPRLPSGGIKGSGIGRELGPHGIREFVNVKQVWIGET